MRCGRCGNENDEANRFCGMCGGALVANDQAGGQVGGRAPLPGQTGSGSTTEQRRAAAASTSDARSDARSDAWPSTRPVISGGPSLLGLNVPGTDTGSGRADSGRDALRPSSSVEYLLEDEEEPRRGWGKLILVVVALALAVGFGYLHWKQGGFDWLNAGDKKPTATTTQTPDAAQSGAGSGGTTTAATAGGAAAQAGAGTAPAPASGGAANPVESAAPQTSPPQTSSQATPSQSTPAETTAPQSSDQPSTPQSNAGDSSAPAGSGAQAADSDSDKESAPAEANHEQRARKPAAAKPAAAKPAAATPVDSVTEAERYIYGRGVTQECDHGLRLLKPAAEQSNVKAMISLGTLYSTGTCTPRDLPTAYRWFALALHKEPDNQALQDDLQRLWSRMTQPERQLAIRLSR